jgi:cyclopropane-fatty-acyl-phospholipid synthase
MTLRSVEANSAPLLGALTNKLLHPFVRRPVVGRLAIELPGGTVLSIGGVQPGPQARMRIRSWRFIPRVVFGSGLGFARSYMDDEWSTPDLPSLLVFMCRNRRELRRPVGLPRLFSRLAHALNRNTRRGSRRNIAAHYDLGNAFYRNWLDSGMMYSSGIYAGEQDDLLQAQSTKLDRIACLLEVSGGERVLEIGCGWGGLAERLAQRYACRVTGLTLSREQFAYARDRLYRSNLADRCEFRLQDYRDADGEYDRIVSVEMLEAVGEAYWPRYFATLRDRLRRNGIAVLQVITIADSRFAAYRRRPDFIQRYIFPGGMLPTTAIVANQISRSGLRLMSVEFFGASYARTLMDWRARFKTNWPAIQGLGFDARFKRMWDYYLSYCQAGFEAGVLDVGLYKIARGS